MKKVLFATAAVIALMLGSLSISAQTQSRDDALKAIATKRAELAKLEKTFMSPSKEDQAAYAEFLDLQDTGLIRLLPREIYDSEGYKGPNRIITVRGGGAYYSFTKKAQVYSEFTDIGLEQGQLTTGFAGANYGMLTNLGDVPLENLALNTPAVVVLASHTAAPDEPHARIEQRRSSSGTTIEGTSYTNRMPLVTNTTYLLRSVNYRASDTLVAFRIVREDTDGSVIIAWKILKRYPIPQLARN